MVKGKCRIDSSGKIKEIIRMFSIVMPAYNAEQFIKRSVESVLEQTYQEFELIIVDDGSIDDTKAIVSAFNDERILYIYQKNQGVSVARNTGILASRYRYICFLDSDDEWKVNHLKVMHSLIEEYSGCGIYLTGYDIRLRNGAIIRKSEQLLDTIKKSDFMSTDGYGLVIRYGYFFNTNTVCCDKKVFEKVGLFATGVKNGEDDDMWLRIFAYFSVAVSKQSTTIYDRAYCGATQQRVDNSDRTFLGRVDMILKSLEVPQSRKESLLIWLEKNKLAQARKLILLSQKRDAWKVLCDIDYSKVNKKKSVITWGCLLVPTRLIRRYVERRDALYFGEKDK